MYILICYFYIYIFVITDYIFILKIVKTSNFLQIYFFFFFFFYYYKGFIDYFINISNIINLMTQKKISISYVV